MPLIALVLVVMAGGLLPAHASQQSPASRENDATYYFMLGRLPRESGQDRRGGGGAQAGDRGGAAVGGASGGSLPGFTRGRTKPSSRCRWPSPRSSRILRTAKRNRIPRHDRRCFHQPAAAHSTWRAPRHSTERRPWRRSKRRVQPKLWTRSRATLGRSTCRPVTSPKPSPRSSASVADQPQQVLEAALPVVCGTGEDPGNSMRRRGRSKRSSARSRVHRGQLLAGGSLRTAAAMQDAADEAYARAQKLNTRATGLPPPRNSVINGSGKSAEAKDYCCTRRCGAWRCSRSDAAGPARRRPTAL